MIILNSTYLCFRHRWIVRCTFLRQRWNTQFFACICMCLWRQLLQVVLLDLRHERCPSQYPSHNYIIMKQVSWTPYKKGYHKVTAFASVERFTQYLPLSLAIVQSSESGWRNSMSTVRCKNKTTSVSLCYIWNNTLVCTLKVVERCVTRPKNLILPLMHLPMINGYTS